MIYETILEKKDKYFEDIGELPNIVLLTENKYKELKKELSMFSNINESDFYFGLLIDNLRVLPLAINIDEILVGKFRTTEWLNK